ncbi:MAG: PTS transporter subunit EIIC [Mycoplasmoidaceae bacterium]|nr:PTS transporter subunit EIIC [Mycoplasmoidaceae bacterium]
MFFSQIAGKNVILTSVDGAQTEVHLTFGLLSKQFEGVFAGQYMEGRYAIMILALPAAALAMLLAVPKGPNRKVAASIILSAALTSFLTGITEPIEFTFLFLAP